MKGNPKGKILRFKFMATEKQCEIWCSKKKHKLNFTKWGASKTRRARVLTGVLSIVMPTCPVYIDLNIVTISSFDFLRSKSKNTSLFYFHFVNPSTMKCLTQTRSRSGAQIFIGENADFYGTSGRKLQAEQHGKQRGFTCSFICNP